MTKRDCAFWCLLLAAGGCGKKAIHPAATPALSEAGFIDLAAGWRLRVIVPLRKAGAEKAKAIADQASVSGSTFTVTVAADFVGYETQLYSVDKQHRGVAIRFASATKTVNNQSIAEEQPTVRLFTAAATGRHHVRLIYLRRASPSDHNMAVLAAREATVLEAATRNIQQNAESCKESPVYSCEWIPAGIAVRPEILRDARTGNWEPAR